MKGFDTKFLEELKTKNDIVDVIGKYVHLEQKGSNFWGRCPFHHEKTASFCVNSSDQFFYCFGCHKGGDVIKFIEGIESVDFNDAVKLLAERVKMPLPEVKYDDEKIKEQKKKKERLLEILRETALFYVANIKSEKAEKHVEYVIKRKITSEIIAKFGIGASLNFNDLPIYLRKKGYSNEEMVEAGVCDSKDGRVYDSMGGRLIIPLINQFGQVVAFAGRVLEKTDFAKYKNTRETSVFTKGQNLFNINNLKKLKNEKGLDSVIIVEGQMDAISLVSGGFNNVVASMGTALTKDQARILKRYCEKVYISYDGDFAGQKASIRGLEILRDEGLEVKVVSLPDGMDPDEIIKSGGHDAYQKLLMEAMPLIDFKLDIVRKTFDITTVDGKRKYITNAIKVIKESPSPAEQEDLLKTVGRVTGITFESLKRELFSIPDTQKQDVIEKTPEFTDDAGDKETMASRFIVASYLFNKPYAEENDINEITFTNNIHKEIKQYIISQIAQNMPIRFSDLYQVIDESGQEELSRIAGLETDENKRFDESMYFADCLKILRVSEINVEKSRIEKLFIEETEEEQRKKYAKELNELLIKKNKLMQ